MSGVPRPQVLLVPGFFGFGRLGEISYFNGVREALEASFAELGVRADVIEVPTLPTASIRERAARVLDALNEVAERSTGPIHIVGHSTGGLDSRLALAPTASLPTRTQFRAYDRVKSLVTVACPHFGTPAATAFSSTLGRALLRFVAAYFIWLLRGRWLLRATLWIGYAIVRVRDPLGKHRGTLEQFREKLLGQLSAERRAELIEFLDQVSSDHSLLFQLTPAGCDLLNACTADPKLAYGSVVTRAPRATLRTLSRSMWDLYTQLMHPLYGWLHWTVARGESRIIPAPVEAQAAALARAYAELPSPADNDGLVPTRSQIWGELIHAAEADHLDVVGQFGRFEGATWGGDWLPSYARFDQVRFEALWADVARFIEKSQREPERGVGTERTEHDLGEAS